MGLFGVCYVKSVFKYDKLQVCFIFVKYEEWC